eukprot:93354-Pleurochrysis_carterae.AAC.1
MEEGQCERLSAKTGTTTNEPGTISRKAGRTNARNRKSCAWNPVFLSRRGLVGRGATCAGLWREVRVNGYLQKQ